MNVSVALNGFAVCRSVNVTATVHVLFGAVKPTVALATPHVVPAPETIAKSPGLVPPTATVLIV